MKNNPKIYILGTGGVGGYFGGKMAKAGHNITFVARGEHYEAMKEKGLQVKTLDGDFTIKSPQVIDDISKIKDPDYILVCTKSYHVEEVSRQLNSDINDDTVIIPVQNGIDNHKKLSKYLTKGKVFPGVVLIISTKTASGVIEQTGGAKKIFFGDVEYKNLQELVELEKLMNESEIDVTYSNEIEKVMWQKFIFINAFSGFTALCRKPIGEIRNDKYTYDLYKRCVEESISVAEKRDVELYPDVFERVIKLTEKTEAGSKSSLLVDVENNRRNEVEALNGDLVRMAEELGLDVPINKTIYVALK